MEQAMIKKFAELFAAPEFIVPYLNYFVSDKEIELVVCLDGEKLTVKQIAERLGLDEDKVVKLLENSYKKSVINKEEVDGEILYYASDFYSKLDYQCKFDENYFNIEKDLRDKLDSWCYEVYKGKMMPYVEDLLAGKEVEKKPETFLLMKDLDKLLDMVQEIRVVPCNCRRLADNCKKPVNVCIAFDDCINDRTFGETLTKEEAKQIIVNAHKKGLMQSINSDWAENGPTWMCNCCSCCCYPTRLATELGTRGVWPLLKYVAEHDENKCNNCGACVRKCNFKAFYFVGENKRDRKVKFDKTKCWGCGICETSCPTKAISIVKID